MSNSRWFQKEMLQAFPLAHMMRKVFPETWLRIHSLPESKRYPENKTDEAIILEKYARFGTALLGEKSHCSILQTRFIGFPRSADLLPELDWQQIHRINIDENDSWNSWSAPLIWDPIFFEMQFLEIANRREANIAFLSNDTDCVFIPYDGGADGFSFDAKLIKRLSEEFAPWRSNHPLGL